MYTSLGAWTLFQGSGLGTAAPRRREIFRRRYPCRSRNGRRLDESQGTEESQWSSGIPMEWTNPNGVEESGGGFLSGKAIQNRRIRKEESHPASRWGIPGEGRQGRTRHTHHFLLRGNVPDIDNPREDITSGRDTILCNMRMLCAMC